jgi:P27 family predicted phage terminase small subunit
MRGRKPAPPELKILQGVRPSRRNDAAPIPREGMPKPRAVSTNQRRIFREIVHELNQMRVHCKPDGLLIEALAGVVDWHRRARAELELSGAWGPGARGGTVTSPAWRVFRDSAREIASISSDLGLSPASRNRVVAGAPPDDLEIERLLS